MPETAAGVRERVAPIRIDGFSKWYGERQVLSDVTLRVGRGETLAVIGKSGCGKSTLLRHVAGLEDGATGRTAGRITLFGDVELSRMSERAVQRRRIRGPRVGLVFQEGALFDFLDVEGNIRWPLEQHIREPATARLARVRAALEMVDLDPGEAFLRRDVSGLSGGERKRVALARAIALEPEIVLYDEPTAGLDPPTAAGISELLNRMKERREMTSVVTSHDMPSMRKVADRIAWIHLGKILFVGTYEEAEAHAEVRRFMEGGS